MTHATQQTSLFAFAEVRKKKHPTLGERQRAVLDELKKHENMTNGELAKALGWPINTVTPRTNELVKYGRVVEDGKRRCKENGTTCIAWRALKVTATPYDTQHYS